ncbi:MAG: prephenate dehydrogenase, partial [Bacteroidetes bacterium]|nr:prephenate dehydrogenase [Bacteroidota bacterium]
MIVTIVGTGLIGGSLAISLRTKGGATHIIGVDHNEDNLKKAQELGIIDEGATLEAAMQRSTVVILA